MRKLLALSAVAASMAALTALPAAAQTLSAYCSTNKSWCDLAAAEYSKATGVKIVQTHLATGEAFARLKAEGNNPKTDIWWGGTGDPFLQAAEEKLLEAYRPAYINDLYDWAIRQYDTSGNMVGGFYTSAIGFGWNTEQLKKKNLAAPKCWADLTDPKYKGEVEMAHPGSSGGAYTIVAGLIQLMGEDKAFDYMKRLHRNITQYTKSSQAQAKNVARGEAGVGISFVFGFDEERLAGFPVAATTACEGVGYEIGGIALIKGARNGVEAKKYYDWLMGPVGQGIGAKANSLQNPANKTFKQDPRIPTMDGVKLVNYDFKKYGASAERKRIIEKWDKEVNSLPR
ncbi:MAG: ABC transporter substrate-binding protein [Betaproteobacteria bacterium]|nr:MAG: ABC transporter substrate-binding protein [Betaproteobacteria bacterium]